jgi:hypothetical protein
MEGEAGSDYEAPPIFFHNFIVQNERKANFQVAWVVLGADSRNFADPWAFSGRVEGGAGC